MLTIGDAAARTGVETWQLRSWERAGLLAPARSPSGYRLYSTDDIEQIQRLRAQSLTGNRLSLYAIAQGNHVAGASKKPTGRAMEPWQTEPSSPPLSHGSADITVAKRLANSVAHAEDPDAVFLELLDCAMELAAATAGSVSFVNPARQQYFVVAHRGLSERYVRGLEAWKLHEGLAGKAYGMREPLIVEDLSSSAGVTREIVRLEGLRAYLCLPLVRGPRCFGVLEVMTRGSRSFARTDVEALSTIVAMLSLVAESAMLATELVAMRDERLRVFRDWADQAMGASEAERSRVLDALREQVHGLDTRLAGGVPIDAAEVRDDLAGVIAGLTAADRSWVDLVPALRDHLLPRLRDDSAKIIGFAAGMESTHLPLTMTSRLYILVSSLIADAVHHARHQADVALVEDARGLVIEIADDREVPPDVDPVAGTPDEARMLAGSIGVELLRGVRAGLGNVITVVVPKEKEEADGFRLTEREWEVLRLLSSGLSNRELAKEFGIAQKTVQNHLTAIYRKIGVSSRGQAIRFALSARQ